MKVKVFEREWTFKLLPGDQFEKRHESAAAITVNQSSEVIFNADDFNLPTVRHELVHVTFYTIPISSAYLNADQLEEVFAEFFGDFGEKMNNLAKKIYRELKKEYE